MEQLEKLFAMFDDMREKANVRAVFGKPEPIGEKTVIPIAAVSYVVGLGYGYGESGLETAEEQDDASGGSGAGMGGGGSVNARPIAVLEVTSEETRLIPVLDFTKIALAGIALVAWNMLWFNRALGKMRNKK